MTRRVWTERQVVALARTRLGTLLGASRVSLLPPPMHGLAADSGAGSSAGGLFVGIESGDQTPQDGRRAVKVADNYPIRCVLQTLLVTSLAGAGVGTQYDDHLDDVRRVVGLMCDLRDDSDERLPVVRVRYRPEWQIGAGRWLVTSVQAEVETWAPLTVA